MNSPERPNINQAATRGIVVPERGVPKDLPKRKGEKDGNRHTVRNTALGILVSTGAAVSSIAALQHHIENQVPISPIGIIEDAGAIPGQVAEWFTGGGNSEVPLTFDLEYDVNRIQGSNTDVTLANVIKMPIGDIEKGTQPMKTLKDSDLTRYPTPSNETVNRYTSKVPFEIPLPFELILGEKINISYVFETKNGNPNYYVKISDLPKDKPIKAPFEGDFSIVQTNNRSGVSTTASIKFKDTEGNVRYLIFDLGESESLIPEDKTPKNPQGDYSWEQTKKVNVGDDLFKANSAMVISVSPGAADKDGNYLKDRDGKPILVMIPTKIKKIDNKAIAF